MAIGPILQQTLLHFGLDSLINWASTAIIQGWTEDQVMLELYNRPEFKQRFPALDQRRSSNLPPISVEEYLSYERTASALASTWGMTLSKSEVDNLIANDVSSVELEQRFTLAAEAVYESDFETIQELQNIGNINDGDLMRYFMNPKAELGRLQTQFRMAQISGAALRTNFGPITAAQSERLASTGLTQQQAISGFSELASSSELFSPINMGESTIDTSTQLDLLTGDASAVQAIEARRSQRKAQFEGGGGYAAGEEGFATGRARP